jgi:Putative beta barrel porin-7 (BBP7)
MAMKYNTFGLLLVILFAVGQVNAQQIGVGQEQLPPGQPVISDANQTVIAPLPATDQNNNLYSHLTANHWDSKSDVEPLSLAIAAMERPKGPCSDILGKGENCPKDWYLDQRVRIMSHPKPRGVLTTTRYEAIEFFNNIKEEYDTLQLKEPRAYNNSATFEPSAGYEVTLGHFLGIDSDNREQYFEFTYYGLNSWSGKYAVNLNRRLIDATSGVTYGNVNSTLPIEVSGFNRADHHRYEYSSSFDNFELNARITQRSRKDQLVLHPNGQWRREPNTGIYTSTLCGIRGFSFDEHWKWLSEGIIEGEGGGAVGGSYTIRTRNDLFGLQMGYNIDWRKKAVTLGVGCKGALFVNSSSQRSVLTSFGASNDPIVDNDYNVNSSSYANSRDIAALGEVNFSLDYQLSQNLTFKADYDMMLVSGVALAPEQIEIDPILTNRVGNGGILFMQSMSLGLEINW